jgi:DNA-binding ferritin-like protein (Dps family)
MKSKLTKGIAKAVAPQLGNIVGQQVKNLTGSDVAGNLTSSLIKQGSQEAFGNGLIGNIMKSKLTKGIAKAVAPQIGNIVGQQVKNLTGSDVASNLTKTLINEGSQEAFGGALLPAGYGIYRHPRKAGRPKKVTN